MRKYKIPIFPLFIKGGDMDRGWWEKGNANSFSLY
jgi:hypothetical protein